MGLRFRKSVNLGGFRINLSKSGIGYSFGARGMRYTKKAKGGSRTTLLIPGTGISYVHDSKKHSSFIRKSQKKTNKPKNDIINYKPKNELINEVVASSSNQFIDKMNEATKKTKILFIIKVFLGIVAGISFIYLNSDIVNSLQANINIVLLSLIICALIAIIVIPKSVAIDLSFNFENEQFEENYKELLSKIGNLNNSDKMWEITSICANNNKKNNAGSNGLASREEVKIEKKSKIFTSNVDIKALKIKKKRIIFLPNIIAIFQNDKWVGVTWEQLKIQQDSTIFIETEKVPCDAEVIGYTYLHPNRNGGPDRRYSNNPQLPQCKYALIHLGSDTGLNEFLMFSNREIAKNFFNVLDKIKKQ